MDGSVQARAATATALVEDSLRGLRGTPKVLSPKWLYDPRGSALFEQITTLPEYYLTRSEAAILSAHADRLAGLVPEGGALVEFGSGASVKTRTLLDAGGHFGAYVPIDISEDFLQQTAQGLRAAYPGMQIAPVVADFSEAVTLPEGLADAPKVGFFPGSTIGNLPPETATALLAHARAWPGAQGFILGVDLVKDRGELVAAYDDSQGVTAQFIGNILQRLNSEAGADFELTQFAYRARWNAAAARIDMELVSTCHQSVALDGETIDFAPGEPIHVSASRKYTRESLSALVAPAGWQLAELLFDEAERFAMAVLSPG
ncbi:L-histidine N(alpha)-methyltransferase [Marinovum sp.]|uniref:L-histidine N(alpha)-methyltransferase n=1 Tax=Marinovum sp. TaxID=2024839 RepID=UPI002B26B622|nr:L-histidine N(alpha)-methyltransferase [Marinovum sp.]